MMTEIKLENKHPTEILNMVQDIKSTGAIIGTDFDFEFYPQVNNWSSLEEPTSKPSYTVFKFYTESLLTLFLLRTQ